MVSVDYILHPTKPQININNQAKKDRAFIVTKIRPQRVAARLATELLCVINDNDDAL